MSKYKKIKKYKDSKFERAVGIPRELFEILVVALDAALKEKHKNGGRTPDLGVEDILLMTLTYYRDYPTYYSLGNQFGIAEAYSLMKKQNE